MKKIGKFAAALVVMAAAIGMMGCAQPSGGNAYTPKYQVGDFVLKTGDRQSKDETPVAGTVAAVIVRADTSTKPALGVGIVHNRSGLAWCTTSAAGYSTNIEALQGDLNSEWDGSDSWAKVKAACSDATDADASKYPAFEYCLKYATTNGLADTLATGWYLPTVAELKTIYDNNKNNDGVIEASLTKAGGNTFGSSWYRSCCQNPSYYYSARVLFFDDGNMSSDSKNDSDYYVCSVRAFN